MKVLGIDATGKAASCAVMENGDLIGESYLNVGLTHSETLLRLIRDLLDLSQSPMHEIDCIAVTNGPGSFTGTRIGVAVAKGLAFPHNTPCHGLSALEAMAVLVPANGDLVCCVMDARRNQVYNALFSVDCGGVTRHTPDRVLSAASLLDELAETHRRVCVVGDATEILSGWDERGSRLRTLPPYARFQRALGAALLCKPDEAGPAEHLTPFYLRVPQAERERLERQAGMNDVNSL